MRIVLILLAALSLSGCFTRYHVTKPDGTELSIMSNREFPEGILVEYESPTGSKLKVDAGSVKAHESSAVQTLAEAVSRLVPALAQPNDD